MNRVDLTKVTYSVFAAFGFFYTGITLLLLLSRWVFIRSEFFAGLTVLAAILAIASFFTTRKSISKEEVHEAVGQYKEDIAYSVAYAIYIFMLLMIPGYVLLLDGLSNLLAQ